MEPKSKADQEKMGIALSRLAAEDPSFRVKTDEESGQTIMAGMGELHLDILVDRMKREFKVEANVGAPQVAYRETITREHEIDYTHKKQSGGSGQFARVKLVLEPGEAGAGFEFESKIVGGNVPQASTFRASRRVSSRVMTSASAGGFPAGRHQGDADRRRLSRRRLVGACLRDRRPRRLPRGLPEGGAETA